MWLSHNFQPSQTHSLCPLSSVPLILVHSALLNSKMAFDAAVFSTVSFARFDLPSFASRLASLWVLITPNESLFGDHNRSPYIATLLLTSPTAAKKRPG